MMVRAPAIRSLIAGTAAVLFIAGASAAKADKALVAVAANFAEAIEALAPEFEAATGHRIEATTGSTGKFYAQIKQGAPFHVLLSADAMTPTRLAEENAADGSSQFTYAIGKLALWSVDGARINGDGKQALSAKDVRHVAMANPDLAPYGVAARETMVSLGMWEALEPKVVMGQNVGQVHSMVATGNAELGFVALSAIEEPGKVASGSYWLVPQELFTPIRQDAILLRAGIDNKAAAAFLDYLRSAEARSVIASFGYGFE